MNLYSWSSTMLKCWANGSIIVSAPTIEEARSKVKAKAFEWLKENKFCEYYEKDDDDRNRMEEYLEKLEKDLAKEPEIMDVIFLNGSE